VDMGLINRRGSWFAYTTQDGKEVSLGQGKLNAVGFLMEHPDIAEELEKRIRQAHLPSGVEDGE